MRSKRLFFIIYPLLVFDWLFQIPEQFRFMSQHPVKKKHRHKKHKGQDSERSKDATDAASQGSKGPLEQDKALATSTGTVQLFYHLKVRIGCAVYWLVLVKI